MWDGEWMTGSQVSSYLKASLTQHPSGRDGAAGSRPANVEERFELSHLVSFLFVGKSPGPEPGRVLNRAKSVRLFTPRSLREKAARV